MSTSVIPLSQTPHALQMIPEPVGLPEAVAQAFTTAMNEVVNLIQSPQLAKRFATVALTKLRTQPDLQLCTPMSLIAAFVEAAEAGLDISGQNECFLIPYKSRDRSGRVISIEATIQLGYAGLVKLAMAHPDVQDVYAEMVCVNDVWVYKGINRLPEHGYPGDFAPRGLVRGFYSVAELSGNRARCLQMSVADMKAHAKQYSRNAEKKVWSDGDGGGFQGMALKTMLRRMCNPKMIPMSARVADILYKMDVVEGVITPEPEDDAPETVEAHLREAAKTIEEHVNDLFPPQDGGPTAHHTPPLPDACEGLRLDIDELLDAEGVTPVQQQRWRAAMAKKYHRESYGDLSEDQYRSIITSLLEAAEAKAHDRAQVPSEEPAPTVEEAEALHEAHEPEGSAEDHDATCVHDEPALPMTIPPNGWREELRHLASNTREVVEGARDKKFAEESVKVCEAIMRLCENPAFTEAEAAEQFTRLRQIGVLVNEELGF